MPGLLRGSHMRRRHIPALLALLAAGLAACSAGEPTVMEATTRPGGDTAKVPLPELGAHTYLGLMGGLYPNGQNTMPADHAGAGRDIAGSIVPLDARGLPSAAGRIVLLSVGMSNTTMEFCSGAFPTCASWSFIGMAAADPAVNHSTLV